MLMIVAQAARLGSLMALALTASLQPGLAADTGDKSHYTLFNPTPGDRLRDFTTDRPDVTEGPFTIDAGHVQFEADIFNFNRSRPDENRAVTERTAIGSFNFRLGVTNDLEVGVAFQPYVRVRANTSSPPSSARQTGPDSIQFRAKFNVFGNDSFDNVGAIAVGLLPFIDIPTAHNGIAAIHVEGGLILPIAVKLTAETDLGLMAEVDAKKSKDGPGHLAEYLASLSLGHQFAEAATGYIEIAARFGDRNPLGRTVLLGGGLLYRVSHDLQIDFGSNFGVTRAADRWNPFIGVSHRF
jgi:hypothetical protein